jgi:hypothetical protein
VRTCRASVAIALGALVCTLGDHLHVVYGVLAYPRPVLFHQAWWVFPLFVGGVSAMLAGCDAVRERLGGERVPTSLGEAALASGWFFVAYAFTAVAADFPSAVLLVLVVTWVVRVRGLPRWVVAFSLVAAAGGVGFEASLSRAGGFAYLNPDFMGVPRWLPGLYLHAALAVPRLRGLLHVAPLGHTAPT